VFLSVRTNRRLTGAGAALALLVIGTACTGSSASPSPSASPPASSVATSGTPSVEPASGRIVFGRYDGSVGDFVVFLIDPNGTSEKQLLPGGYECPRWSPNWKDISLGSGIYENAGQPGGSFRAFTTFANTVFQPDPTLNLGCPVWSADGSRLAYEGWDDTDLSRNGIYTLNTDGGDLQRLTSSPNGSHDVPGDYSADGSQLYFAREGQIMVVGVAGGEPRKVGTGGLPSLSPDGQTLVAVSHDNLELIAIDGNRVTPVIVSGLAFGVASWSPDGAWIVFTSGSNDHGNIARVHSDGSGLFIITRNPANEEFADWAP
jgi:Tol biopolymer transport system component